MCVIIYLEEGTTIDRDELEDAWFTNPDGAGFMYQDNGEVKMERGFMNREEYINRVLELVGKYNIALHFRITTSKQVNKLQTHPYCSENINLIKHHTKNEVIAMNGIVKADYKHRVGWNDTMCYIADNKYEFSVANQHIIDMIEEETGCRWIIMRPNEVLLSKGFKKRDGKWYSNTNHLDRFVYYTTGFKKSNKKNKKSNITYYEPYDYGYSYDDWNSYFTENGLFGDDKEDEIVYEVVTDPIEEYCANQIDYDKEICQVYGEMDYSNWEVKPTQLFTKSMIKKLKKDKILWGYLMQYIFIECNCQNGRNCGLCVECFESLKTKAEIVEKLNNEYAIGL